MAVDWSAILKQRCPRCRTGAVFHGVVRMNRRCPECELSFEREPGYFLGAMYFSYGLGILVAAPLALGLYVAADVSVEWIGLWCGLELAVLAPWLFRYSRVFWLHLDQHFDAR